MPSKSTCLFAILAFAATLSTVDADTVDAHKVSEQEQPTLALNRPSKLDLPNLSFEVPSTNFPDPIGETRRPPKFSLSRPSLSVEVPEPIGETRRLPKPSLSRPSLSVEVPEPIGETRRLPKPSLSRPSLSVEVPEPIGETRRLPKPSLSKLSLAVQVPSTDFSADPAAEPPKSVVSPRLSLSVGRPRLTIPMLSLGVPSADTPVKQPLRKPFDFSAFNLNGDLSDSRPAATEITSDILKNPKRVVAVGDVHSDLRSFLAVLIRANLVKITKPAPVKVSIWGENMPEWVLKQEEKVSHVQWAGREGDVLVQTGDMVDRGEDTIAVYTLLKKLKDQAEKAGGEVVPLLGNHETMRIFKNGALDFEDYQSFSGGVENDEYANRDEAFEKTGFLGKWIRSLDTAKIVGDALYSHAGILPGWADKRNIAKINRDIRDAMNSENNADVEIVTNKENALYNRRYGKDNEEKICPTVQKALDHFKITEEKKIHRMVVGHTPDIKGQIRSKCDNSLLLIDVGLSKGMYNDGIKRLAALEILYDDGATHINALYDKNETVELMAPVYSSPKRRRMD